MNEFTELAERAGRESGAFLKEKSKSVLTIEKKGQIDLVTDADRGAEKIIKDIILSEYPDHKILAEEGGATANDSSFLWLVDPLDGTTNFAHGLPFYCVSIACWSPTILEIMKKQLIRQKEPLSLLMRLCQNMRSPTSSFTRHFPH